MVSETNFFKTLLCSRCSIIRKLTILLYLIGKCDNWDCHRNESKGRRKHFFVLFLTFYLQSFFLALCSSCEVIGANWCLLFGGELSKLIHLLVTQMETDGENSKIWKSKIKTWIKRKFAIMLVSEGKYRKMKMLKELRGERRRRKKGEEIKEGEWNRKFEREREREKLEKQKKKTQRERERERKVVKEEKLTNIWRKKNYVEENINL